MMRITGSVFGLWLATVGVAQEVTVRGLLLDGDNKVAVGVPIATLADQDYDVLKAIKNPIATSLEDGTFTATLAVDEGATRYLLIGGKRFAVCRIRVTATSNRDLGPITLARGFMATGRIRSADGVPLVGAYVIGTDLLPTRRFMSNLRQSANHYQTSAIVPESGIFMLPGMLRSAGLLRVTCPGYYDELVQPVAMGTPLDITLHRAPTITGRTLDEQGRPLAGATVRVGTAMTTSGEDGSFTIHPRARRVASITAWLRRDEVQTTAKADCPQPLEPIELKLQAAAEKPSAAIRVRAVAADGSELKTFTAYTSWNPSNQLQYRPDAQLVTTAAKATDHHGQTTSGEVALTGTGNKNDDSLLIFVRAEGHGWGRLEADPKSAGGAPVVVKLPKPAQLSGQVLDKVTGKPMAGVTITPTQELSDNAKQWFGMGHFAVSSLNGPDITVTDADGNWQLRDLPPGSMHVFLSMNGQKVRDAQTFELKEGEAIDDIRFEIPSRATLRGSMPKETIAGMQVRTHWHRPNMSSSSWDTEYDGAVSPNKDGSFEMPDLPPLVYEVQAMLPPPPRAGLRRKLPCTTWDGAAPPKEALVATHATIHQVQGRVEGEVPWSRLGVLAIVETPNTWWGQFAPPGTIALLEPDRTFKMLLPEEATRMVVFDVLTGIAIEFRDVEPGDLIAPIVWAGKSHALTVDLKDTVASETRVCLIEYEPTEDHWPLRVLPGMPQQGRTGMQTDAYSGAALQLWLPAKEGKLTVANGKAKLELQVERIATTTVTIRVDQDLLEQVQ